MSTLLWLSLLMPPTGPATPPAAQHISADVLIVGGTESGCAAAVQAARMGVRSIVLVNDIEWLGGQFTAEALVAIDENRGPAGYDQTVPFPRSGFFKEVIDGIEAQNLDKYGHPRPGNTRVITTCRPADAEEVFRDLLAPYVRTGQIEIFSHFQIVEALREGKRVTGARFESLPDGAAELTVSAGMTIDATDWGDVIKAAGAAYEFGPDLNSKYGEPLAPTSRAEYPQTDMNPITYCLVINETDQYTPIPAPPRYDARNYRTHKWPKDPVWLYPTRRLIDHYNLAEVSHPDVLLLCFPAFDYPLDVLPQHVADALEADTAGASHKNIVEMTRAQRQIIFDDAKQYALGFLHYLQTEVHDAMPDQTHSFRRFVLSDEFGTPDRMPFKPYVRESLRLQAMYMLRQQDTTGWGNNARNYALAMPHDGVACWQFEYDFHPTKRVFLDEGRRDGPWINDFRPGRTWGPPYAGKSLFPLRSLVPATVDGLLGAQKNLGYSSIVSSAVRLHDQSIAIGTAVGAVAAVALKSNVEPRAIPYDRQLLSRVWAGLCSRHGGAQPHMLWPFCDLPPDHPAFIAANLLAVRGGLPLQPRETSFRAEDLATAEWRQEVVRLSLATKSVTDAPTMPAGEMTRGDFVLAWWKKIANLPDAPFDRQSLTDADADGVADQDDALLFHPHPTSWPEYSLSPEVDGNPDSASTTDSDRRQFNFVGKDGARLAKFTNDHGLPFTAKRGFGWQRDLSANNRRRNQAEGVWRDTFLFTRSHDIWELAVANGRYTVTVCVGDSGHEQTGQNVTVEGTAVLRNHDTPAGEWAERTAKVVVEDGRLTVEIGLPGSKTNTCINWLRVVPEK